MVLSLQEKNTSGLLAGILAFLLWGILPLYWKGLHQLPAATILGHRIFWSFVFMVLVISLSGRWGEVRDVFRAKKGFWLLCLSGLLLAINWLTYIWGVNAGYVLQASMGYYINPLVNVLLGFLFFQDKLRSLQILAITLAAVGVGYLVFNYGQIPWIALTLAFTFGFYGLIRKKVAVEPLPGLLVEMMILSCPALIYLLISGFQDGTPLKSYAVWVWVLLFGSGIITALPLLLFTFCARRLRLVEVGILQYLAPTCMFLLGVFAFHEPFPVHRLIAFLFIWSGVLFYVLESFFYLRTMARINRTQEP
ncbi:MAG: EamA family transporter RarD [Desulfohalobiaceae bacterium]|nr:EamA family transporter RarD [Desulfohalobiaceae bacterium]